jgi:hypothetical protein
LASGVCAGAGTANIAAMARNAVFVKDFIVVVSLTGDLTARA